MKGRRFRQVVIASTGPVILDTFCACFAKGSKFVQAASRQSVPTIPTCSWDLALLQTEYQNITVPSTSRVGLVSFSSHLLISSTHKTTVEVVKTSLNHESTLLSILFWNIQSSIFSTPKMVITINIQTGKAFPLTTGNPWRCAPKTIGQASKTDFRQVPEPSRSYRCSGWAQLEAAEVWKKKSTPQTSIPTP